MTVLAALAGFAALFALAGIVPLKGEDGGCGACAHAGSGGCSTGGCELIDLPEGLDPSESTRRTSGRRER